MNGDADSRATGAKPWGRVSTLGLGFLALLAGQIAALAALTWWYGRGLAQLPDFAADGVAVTLIILISTPVQLVLLWVMASRAGGDPARYLGLVWPSKGEVLMGAAAVVVFIVVGNVATWLAGKNIVTGFQIDIYRTASAAGWLPWLWLIVVVVTPIGEETLFRGFLFRGWHRTSADAWIVILATAALFAVVHVQYDFYVMGQVFVSGLILGWFRWATGSTILTMLMHAMINFEGMLETFLTRHG